MKQLLLLFLLIALGGCIQNTEQEPDSVWEPPDVTQEERDEQNDTIATTGETSSSGLGDLCSDSSACSQYCNSFSLECENYCRQHPENTLCKELFLSEKAQPEHKGGASSRLYPELDKHCTRKDTRKDAVTFTYPPAQIEDVELIEPLGKMTGGHVTPVDHGYFYPKNWEPQDNPDLFIDVYAPADGIIAEISLVGNRRGDYRMVIYHTCTFFTIYIHIKELSSRIEQEIGDVSGPGHTYPYLPIKAGELLGRANSFDFSVHNEDTILPGFIFLEHYRGEPWKIHTVDMFNHFAEPLRTELLAKNLRAAEPRAGKIDYDIDGTLAGNWFVEDTNWYEGDTSKEGEYWKTHLTFAYDYLVPDLIIVSIGDFDGQSRQFAVKGNTPDPASVNSGSGIVRYELVGFEYLTEKGAIWNRHNFATIANAKESTPSQGMVLVEMVDARKIRFEAFPGKKPSQIEGFTSAARMYER